MKSNTKQKVESFLAGARFANGHIATSEEYEECSRLIMTDKWEEKFSEKRANLLEGFINLCALNIVRFGCTEYSNDYYDWANNLMDCMQFIDKNAKRFKYGKYFSLT